MVVIFNKLTGKAIMNLGLNSAYPNGQPISDELAQQIISNAGEFVEYRINDDEGIVKDILSAGTTEAIFNELGETIGINIYKKISITTDKPSIIADGIDTATITATVDDINSTELIELYLGDTLLDSKNAVSGVVTFEITMTQTGVLDLTVKSTTKYGQANIQIEGVVV